ncbi:MAG TPA: histidine phosphatase family protein [Dermatophilaceae bacterium]|nr:histidine phosphatase family protein [Dermatophilaceae bacterium]
MPIALLVRHGRTAANTGGVLAGWTPGVGLDDTGRIQVGGLAERLAGLPVRAIVTSPLQRCQETAALLAGRLHGIPVVAEDDLGECRYGAWTGRLLRDLAKDPLWRSVQDQPSAVRFPDGQEYPGESMAEMQLRAVRAVRRWDARVAREHGPRAVWVAVSHGDVIKAVLADAAGTHLDHFQRIVADPASLSAVSYTERRPFVLRTNDVGGDLASLVPAEPAGDGAGDAAGDAAGGRSDVPEGDAAVGGGPGRAAGSPD